MHLLSIFHHHKGGHRSDVELLRRATHLVSLTHASVLPELTSEENAVLLDRWEGSWSYLTNMKWIRLSEDGKLKSASFPPKGDH